MATVAVLGAGMMGTALCVPLLDRGHEVRLVGTHLDRSIIDRMQRDSTHPKLGVSLAHGASYHQVEALPKALEGADFLALGVNSQGLRWAGRTIGPHLNPECPVLAVTKGLEWDGVNFVVLPQVLLSELPETLRDQVHSCAIAGPCIAGELARRVETCVVFTGNHMPTLQRLADWARTDYYHVSCSTDVIGTEVCAALKNGYAMAIGFAAGLHDKAGGAGGPVAMHNYEAAVFVQALAEMALWVDIAGGRSKTVYGLAGAGDLEVTCSGGRTGRFGRWLGRGLSLVQAIEKMQGATLECLEIIRVLGSALPQLETTGRIRRHHVPLLHHLYQVVTEGQPVDVPFERFFGSKCGS